MAKDYTLEELKALNVTKLKKIAKSKGVSGYSKYKAADKNKLAKKIFEHSAPVVAAKGRKPKAVKYSEKELKKQNELFSKKFS